MSKEDFWLDGNPSLTRTRQILENLIAFPTISRNSNREMIRYIQSYLADMGIDSQLAYNDEQTKANLHTVIGPKEVPGILLSGHTDVVPVEGQAWTVDPFNAIVKGGRLYGRGSTDMKGFIACVLAMLPDALNRNLRKSLHLCFSYDEEVGCIGVRRMIDILKSMPNKPAFCIVGEPTEMRVAIAHKGKLGAVCHCRGVEAHSALANSGLNAIYLASEMISAIQQRQEKIRRESRHDHHYSVPYTTFHVGTIQGGTALNIIPKECRFEFEIRNLQSDCPEALMGDLRMCASEILGRYRDNFPEADITIEVFNQYPALATSPEERVVRFVQSLVETDRTVKLDFGTEGGLFQNQLGVPTVVCGPGSMDQGHKADEYIALSELQRCDHFLKNLIARISD